MGDFAKRMKAMSSKSIIVRQMEGNPDLTKIELPPMGYKAWLHYQSVLNEHLKINNIKTK